jgi:hypothetical protein
VGKKLVVIVTAAIALLPWAGTTSVAWAQAAGAVEVAPPISLPEVTQGQVLAACSSDGATEANCKAVIAAYFAYLESTGVIGADLESAIATLVVALAEADVAPEIQTVVVAAIEDIGTNYATGEQAQAILTVAQTIEEGGDVETAALGVSPT